MNSVELLQLLAACLQVYIRLDHSACSSQPQLQCYRSRLLTRLSMDLREARLLVCRDHVT